MTEYSEHVEIIRQKNAAEKWGKTVNYIIASNGIVETCFNNGDKQFVDREGNVRWERSGANPMSIMDKFNRFLADSPWYSSRKES